jgi:hypothetical protein
MLNPYVILGLVLFWGASCVGSYLKGSEVAQNEAKARFSEQLEATIAQAREDSVIDMMAATEAEAKRHKSRIVYRDRIVKVKESINEIPTSCAIPDAAVRLLNESIRDANHSAPTPKSVPLPANPTTFKRGQCRNLD